MKISPEKIIIENKNIAFKKNVFLISGNEETLIKKTEEILILILKKKGFVDTERSEGGSLINFYDNKPMLFSKTKILIHNNPKDINMNYFDNVDLSTYAIIISFSKLKNSSKVKKEFDTHREFYSISCYKMTKEIKKKYLDFFLNQNSISIDEGGYWFFLDLSSNLYAIFDKELEKLLNFKNKISHKEAKMLLSESVGDEDMDELFFLILSDSKKIILETNKSLSSSSLCYILLQRTKFFFNQILISDNVEQLKNNFPRYLFSKKNDFVKIFNKIDKNKLIKILKLIKKTEILLRKNDAMFLPITQRFLLNIKRSLK